MTNITEQKTEPTPPPRWSLETIPRTRIANGLLASVLAFLWIPLYVIFYLGFGTHWPYVVWGCSMVGLLAGMGTWLRYGDPIKVTGKLDLTRLACMMVGGCTGFLLFLLALMLPLGIEGFSTVLTGGLEVWRQNWGTVLLFVGAMVGGLVLMFLSLQLGRTVERSNPTVRRLLYGYNAILTGLLLLGILTLVNIVISVDKKPFTIFSKKVDWTFNQSNSISPALQNFLAKLDKPLKVFVILPRNEGRLKNQCETLLRICKESCPSLSYETLDADLNDREIALLARQYQLADVPGMLVIYGQKPAELWDYIPVTDLTNRFSRRPGDTSPSSFRGEAALMKVLTFLADDKKKPIVYFTQGSREPSITPGGKEVSRESLGLLRRYLNDRNYEVKELRIRPGDEKAEVPTDATAVVVVNPQLGMSPSMVKALTDYMNPNNEPGKRKGKMIVLFDVNPTPDLKGMVPTGLESLLTQFNVGVSNERLLDIQEKPPGVRVMPVLIRGHINPIAQAFYNNTFLFEDTRAVEALPPANNPRAGMFQAEPLLVAYPQHLVWKESNLSDPVALIAEIRKNRQRIEEVLKKVPEDYVPVAVTVSESTMNIPGHPATGKDEKPRLVVFGDSTWITDRELTAHKTNADLFISCLSWLRERADLGAAVDIEPKETKEFSLPSTDNGTVWRLYLLPGSLICMGIVALGGGIWVTRRR